MPYLSIILHICLPGWVHHLGGNASVKWISEGASCYKKRTRLRKCPLLSNASLHANYDCVGFGKEYGAATA